jgi:hypothetical protein
MLRVVAKGEGGIEEISEAIWLASECPLKEFVVNA